MATSKGRDVIKDWGEREDYGRIRGRKGKNIAGGPVFKAEPPAKRTGRDELAATVRKAPEVLVKISGGGKDMRTIKAHMDYISRNGAVELEDDQGQIHQGKEEVRGVRDGWFGGGVPYENGPRREAFNIVLSMPPGTDRALVKSAARNFARELFGHHQYVFAAHEDEKHPHVHLNVKALDHDGVRLNPRKADLQRWREVFAEKMREQGVDANATPRRVRGIVKKADKQAIRHIDQEHRQGKRKKGSRIVALQEAAASLEVATGRPHENPAHGRIVGQRKAVHQQLGAAARALAAGAQYDKMLALGIVQFVQQMPPLKTRHMERVEALQRAREAARRGVQDNSNEHGSGLVLADRGRGQEDDKGQER